MPKGKSTQGSDATSAFFDALVRRGHEPALEYVSGSIAIEVTNGRAHRRWLVDVRNGDIRVSRRRGGADCTLRADEAVFERILRGRTSAMTAMLRGELTAEGDPRLLVLFRRLLPAPRASNAMRRQ